MQTSCTATLHACTATLHACTATLHDRRLMNSAETKNLFFFTRVLSIKALVMEH